MKSSRHIFALLLSILILGCSNSGRSVGKVSTCLFATDYLAIEEDKNYANKIVLKPNEPIAAHPTDFAFKSAQVFYNDTVNDIRIMLSSERQKDGSLKTTVSCVGGRGLKPTSEPLHVEVPVISDLLVNGTTTEIRTRLYKIDFKKPEGHGAWLVVSEETTQPQFVPGNVLDFYSNYQDVAQYFTQLSRDLSNYQLVSHMTGVASDNKSGREGSLILRTLVNYSPVTADERKSRDDQDNKIKNP